MGGGVMVIVVAWVVVVIVVAVVAVVVQVGRRAERWDLRGEPRVLQWGAHVGMC